MNPRDIVRTGYDRLGASYRAHFAPLHALHYPEWIALFQRHVPLATKVLELGCGDGWPVASDLAQHYDYLGIDFSTTQISAAKQHVPGAQFLVADMTALEFPNSSFAGLIALYSIIHIPLEQQRRLLHDIFDWLSVGGIFMATLGVTAWTGMEQDWILPGTQMYWSHTTSAEYADWLTSIGFELLEQRLIPEGKACHTFIMARKPIPQQSNRDFV